MKENDIRKRSTFNKYLELVEKDAREFFDPASFAAAGCPSCGGAEHTFEFEKVGFKYVSCKKCSTLFVNPRPPFNKLKEFYSNSPSTSYWVNEFFKPVAAARREKIFRPRAEYLAKMLGKSGELVIGDIGAGFGIFLEELRDIASGNKYIAVEPSLEMADICKKNGLEVECACMEDITGLDGSFDVLSIFELAEHLHDPFSFFKKAHSLLKPGGRLFATTLNGMGFDILLLWEKSKSISPPHHLNFFNPHSLRYLMERIGFEAEEVSTPGKLDWDIVEGMIKDEGVKAGRLWEMVARSGTDVCKEGLQDWIASNDLSSHMRIIARKKGPLS